MTTPSNARRLSTVTSFSAIFAAEMQEKEVKAVSQLICTLPGGVSKLLGVGDKIHPGTHFSRNFLHSVQKVNCSYLP